LHSVTKKARIMTEELEEEQSAAEAERRRTNAQLAALTRAARTDGREISAPARTAFMKRFETRHECKLCGIVEINQSLPADQRARAVRAAIRVHFIKLQQSRRRLAAMSQTVHSELSKLDDRC
jgi:hypothetical protein